MSCIWTSFDAILLGKDFKELENKILPRYRHLGGKCHVHEKNVSDSLVPVILHLFTFFSLFSLFFPFYSLSLNIFGAIVMCQDL